MVLVNEFWSRLAFTWVAASSSKVHSFCQICFTEVLVFLKIIKVGVGIFLCIVTVFLWQFFEMEFEGIDSAKNLQYLLNFKPQIDRSPRYVQRMACGSTEVRNGQCLAHIEECIFFKAGRPV
jgi:hypothetical protein